jgi:3-hydroxyacyl-CoA dehydrogenase/enoyl-CoA hydratase/3-hydroxybutyryl-CoA epimerase
MTNAWTLETSEGGIGRLVLDVRAEKVNILSGGVLEELDRWLDEAADRADLKALLVVSGKPGTFIAGADVGEIGAIETAAAGEAAAARGQSILHRLSVLGKPTLAAIDGACLGGGLELALACSFRIAALGPATRLGLPEVRLGIIPGFGGTQRLPRLVGLPAAVDLILTGKTIDAGRAERMGLVDQAVPAALLRARAEAWLRHAVERSKHTGRWARLMPRAKRRVSARIAQAAPVRPIVFALARRRLRATLSGDYPAPFAALDAIDESFHVPLEAGLKHEAELVGPLLVTPTCKNLTWLFGASNTARREGRVLDPLTGHPAAARPVRNAAVLGAGVMGGGIAHLLAQNGVAVRLKDVAEGPLLKGLQAAAELVGKEVQRRRIDRREGARRMARIAPTLTWDGLGAADIVIEAVVEDLAVKRAVLADVEARVRPECVFATNTSSLPIAEIAKEARHPERVVGLHFFNPVHRMPLVEVIAGAASSPEALATAHALARKLGKTPIVVKDSPGFLVNRVLTAYLAEALRLFVEGSDPVTIDRAMEHFGMPMGPFQLLDQIGLDTASKASKAIEAVNERYLPRGSVLSRLIEKGRLGAKNGRGFYRWKKGRVAGFDRAVLHLVERHGAPVVDFEVIESRLYLPMVNEAVRCLAAGVAASPEDIDLGMVLGTGFPPFRGGPLRNADIMGLPAIVEKLNQLAAQVGERLAPHPELVERALGGRRFYAE